jgi:hypothetical protein
MAMQLVIQAVGVQLAVDLKTTYVCWQRLAALIRLICCSPHHSDILFPSFAAAVREQQRCRRLCTADQRIRNDRAGWR